MVLPDCVFFKTKNNYGENAKDISSKFPMLWIEMKVFLG